MGQGGLVDSFQKAWAEDAVDFHGGADEGVGELFVDDLDHEMLLCFLPRITQTRKWKRLSLSFLCHELHELGSEYGFH